MAISEEDVLAAIREYSQRGNAVSDPAELESLPGVYTEELSPLYGPRVRGSSSPVTSHSSTPSSSPLRLLALAPLALLALVACGGPTTATVTPKPSASPVFSPVAIGDACLVGNWFLADEKVVLANNNGSVEGGAGAKLILAASGQGSLDFTASEPASGTAGGSSLSILDAGSLSLTALATNGSLTLTVTANNATVTVTQGSSAATPQAYVVTPGAYAYTCTAKMLTLTRSVSGDQETQTYAKP